jgi:hypothetical protein
MFRFWVQNRFNPVVLSLLTALSACRPQSPAPATGDAETSAAGGGIKAGPVGEADLGGIAELREAILKVNTRAEVDPFLDQLAKNYDSASPEVKYVSAHLRLIKPLKALVYRATPVFSSANATHSMVLTAVQQASSGIATYLPTAQWRAIFDYVTQPDDASTPKYANVEAMQNDTEDTIIPLLAKVITDLEALNITDSKPIVWDKRISYGTASFRDPQDRFVKIGAAEYHAELATLRRVLAGLRMACAYNLNDLPQVTQSLGKIIGIDGFLFTSVKGSPLSARVNAISRFRNFLTLRAQANQKHGYGAALMLSALQDLKAADAAAAKSWDALKGRNSALGGQEDNYWAMNPRAAAAVRRIGDLAVNESRALLAGPTQIYSAVTNEAVSVNAPQFFNQPPADLKAFFPTSFVSEEFTNVAGARVPNYLWGSPTAWNVSAFTPYIPAIRSNADVPKVARILSQSWGGGGVGAALAPFVN